jgi:arginine exporter protein ArgO
VARIWFFIGLVAGAVMYSLALSGIVAWGRRFVTAHVMSKINLGAALFLVALAIFLAFRVVRLFGTM